MPQKSDFMGSSSACLKALHLVCNVAVLPWKSSAKLQNTKSLQTELLSISVKGRTVSELP